MSETQNSTCSAIEGLRLDYISQSIRPSLGVRKAGSSGGGIGGISLNPASYRVFGTDSNFERDTALQLSQRDDVVHVQEQPFRTPWLDRHGVEHNSTWDFAATLKDGTVEAYSCKRLEIAETPGFQDDFRRICEGVPAGVADTAQVFTEWNLRPELVDRGELYQRALLEPEPAESADALRFIAAAPSAVKVQEVCDFLRSKAKPIDPMEHFEALSREFWAVVWLLAKRRIRMVHEEFLNTRSEVYPA